MEIAFVVLFGLAAGLLVGILVARTGLGCLILCAIPVAMIVYVSWWQGQNPDSLNSTSALAFVFEPLWPSLGALAGFLAGKALRSSS